MFLVNLVANRFLHVLLSLVLQNWLTNSLYIIETRAERIKNKRQKYKDKNLEQGRTSTSVNHFCRSVSLKLAQNRRVRRLRHTQDRRPARTNPTLRNHKIKRDCSIPPALFSVFLPKTRADQQCQSDPQCNPHTFPL